MIVVVQKTLHLCRLQPKYVSVTSRPSMINVLGAEDAIVVLIVPTQVARTLRCQLKLLPIVSLSASTGSELFTIQCCTQADRTSKALALSAL